MRNYFRDHLWPWYVLSTLCLLLGCLLLFRGRHGCADVARLNVQLAALDDAMSECCRCATSPVGGVNPRPRRPPGNDDEPDDVEVIDIDEDAYNEEIDDRREEAGGQTGELAVTLSWNNVDDLDLSVIEPGGFLIDHGNRISPNGGELDVDQNYRNRTTTPIENVFWSNAPSGTYRVRIILFQRKATSAGARIPVTVQISRNGQRELRTFNVSGDANTVVQEFTFDYP